MRYFTVIFIFILFLQGCQLFEELITDDTPMIEVYKIEGEINQLDLLYDMDLELVQSTDSVLEIYTQKGLFESIQVIFTEGILSVDYKKFSAWRYPKPKLVLKIPVIPYIRSKRFNNITSEDTIRQNNLRIFSDGTGDILLKLHCQNVDVKATHISNFILSGETKELSGSFEYSGILSAARLKAESVYLTQNGSNDLVVSPSFLLICNMLESGNIFYVKQPQELEINYGQNGTGKVIYDPSKDK